MKNRSAMIIAVASGKGGTGKTTVAAHLALALAKSRKTMLIDLDVEAPDSLGYFPEAQEKGKPKTVTVFVPRLAPERCTGCGLCAKSCRFGAIVAIGGVVTIETTICKGCGRCVAVCPAGALSEVEVEVGTVLSYGTERLDLLEGRMVVGDIRATAVIEAAKETAENKAEVQVRDCPPGVSCPAVHALAGADYAVLVAEPTAFSLHDLDAAVRLAKGQGIPTGIVVNKDGFGGADVDAFAALHKVPILGRITFSRERAQSGAAGRLWADDPEASKEFDSISNRILAAAPGRTS